MPMITVIKSPANMVTVTKDAEPRLVDMASNLRDDSAGWTAIQFNFSGLQEHYRSDYQLKIAVNMANDLLKTMHGGIYVCRDCTIFVVCRNMTEVQVEKLVFQLRYLFQDDPLAYTGEGAENPAFCTIYNVANDWQGFFNACKNRVRGGGKPAPGAAAPAGSGPVISSTPANVPSSQNNPGVIAPYSPQGKLKLFTPAHLATIERDLANADLSHVMRRQAICAAPPGMDVREVLDEQYINIAHLRQLLKTDVDFNSNRWLFKYLTQILDARMLDLIKRNATRYFESPASLNLNVETLLSDTFLEFDAAVKPATKVSIVIEIHVADVFADMSAFLLAKDSVQKLGYRVLLDGLTNLSFMQIDRERLGFDLAKLMWNADMASDLRDKEHKHLAEAIRNCGANRVILCRCDNRAAIDYGQALGISLFQGRYIDKILNPASRVEN